ncbi:hypothetical protein CERZMDRAFT_91941 [Cercospora zeae-maydis SCOH1-5]|uniref:Uncharacterized protein n=1 Tax=Cercospora zeae-maydis SCOH1-5 TaxID=717836 RepID=A0A6A6EXZ7_9PEZI|nr:hypothetical protein CERZMDRAFT_91941 [Cercospora zeae-maydis SCOH1-5]
MLGLVPEEIFVVQLVRSSFEQPRAVAMLFWPSFCCEFEDVPLDGLHTLLTTRAQSQDEIVDLVAEDTELGICSIPPGYFEAQSLLQDLQLAQHVNSWRRRADDVQLRPFCDVSLAHVQQVRCGSRRVLPHPGV